MRPWLGLPPDTRTSGNRALTRFPRVTTLGPTRRTADRAIGAKAAEESISKLRSLGSALLDAVARDPDAFVLCYAGTSPRKARGGSSCHSITSSARCDSVHGT